MRIVIVEDEIRLARNIAQILQERENFAADVVHNGRDGLHQILSEPYDLVILDIMLPELDGLKILSQIRGRQMTVPVLLLTARDTPGDVVEGLNAGGDDYLTKPFDMGELIARCKALIRRSYRVADPHLRIGALDIDLVSHKVESNGRRVALTAMEYRTLEYLAMRKGQIVSKEALLEHLYDFNWEKFSNVIEVYISIIRKKIDPDHLYEYIKTVRGQGYILEEA